MSGGSGYDTGGEDSHQVEKHLHAPANLLIMSLIFFLIIDIIFFAQGADTWNVWPRVWKLHGKFLQKMQTPHVWIAEYGSYS